MKKIKIAIGGMHCKSCKNSIESKIGGLKGVSDIKVNLSKNNALVKFNPEKISLEQIKSNIKELGYPAGNETKTPAFQGLMYGIIPHIGCIAFIIGSVLGVTVLMQFFKPLLMNKYFFYILFALSLGFATLSAFLYLRSNGLASLQGAKLQWKYLSVMYGSTIGINLLLFMVIFPLLSNVTTASSSSGSYPTTLNANSSLKLQVDIPCPGHAPLISSEVRAINGVRDVQFSFPNIFDIKYDSSKTSRQQILALDVFKEYKATVLDSSANQNVPSKTAAPAKSSQGCGGGGCGCGCGG